MLHIMNKLKKKSWQNLDLVSVLNMTAQVWRQMFDSLLSAIRVISNLLTLVEVIGGQMIIFKVTMKKLSSEKVQMLLKKKVMFCAQR